jgi:hypothetical protein
VSKIINRNAEKLALPNTTRNHYVFHVSQLDYYTLLDVGQPSLETHSIILVVSEEQEVEWILDYK